MYQVIKVKSGFVQQTPSGRIKIVGTLKEAKVYTKKKVVRETLNAAQVEHSEAEVRDCELKLIRGAAEQPKKPGRKPRAVVEEVVN